MNHEYLLFNALIVTGPVLLSFDREVRYVSKWIPALLATLGAGIPFLFWDVLVTGRHWWFNPEFTMTSKILGLPPGEWLFFVTVPFASLFIWEIFSVKLPVASQSGNPTRSAAGLLLVITGIPLFLLNLEYTGLVVSALGLVILVQYLLKVYLTKRAFLGRYLLILTALIFVFNGYLTARPVVLYDTAYQLNLRILTIPIEDFLYGYALILLAVLIFEKLKEQRVYV